MSEAWRIKDPSTLRARGKVPSYHLSHRGSSRELLRVQERTQRYLGKSLNHLNMMCNAVRLMRYPQGKARLHQRYTLQNQPYLLELPQVEFSARSHNYLLTSGATNWKRLCRKISVIARHLSNSSYFR